MWDVLAIAPTDDPKVIRRAYAARLKQIDPDRDRETFVRLRQALEWALASARQPPRRPPPPPPEPAPADDATPSMAVEVAQAPQPRYEVRIFPAQAPVTLRQPPTPPPNTAEERANERALLIGLEAALQRHDAREASQLYVRAAATGALPLGDAERMLARLFTVALEDASFDGPAFRALAKSFGWDRPDLDSATVAEVRQRVMTRLAAEDWYDALVGIADRKRWWFRGRRSRVARLMLRRIRGWGLLRIDRPALRATLDALKPHEIWLRDRIAPEWVATLERRMRRRELIASAASTAFFTFLLLDAAVVIIGGVVGAIKEDATFGILILIAVMAVLIWMLQAVVKNFIGMWRSPP
jgi:hypothetical protein